MKNQIKNSLEEVNNKSLMVINGVSDESGLEQYINNVNNFPILSPDKEYDLATRWKKNKDLNAAKILVASHLRLVVSIAYNFKNYGIPISDLISSGNLGLMQALQKFEPDKGFRFSTYAMFWIKAEIYENVLNNWSIVKIGTSANQKKIFFNLSKAKKALGIMDNRLSNDQTKQIANFLQVPEKDIINISTRILSRDLSLNTPINNDSDSMERISNLVDNRYDIQKSSELDNLRNKSLSILKEELLKLPERDRDILKARRLQDPISTLESLSIKYGISKERVRQIEDRAFNKIKRIILENL